MIRHVTRMPFATLSVLTAAAISLGARSAVAQDQSPIPSTTQMVLKGRAPVSSEVLKVRLPKPDQEVLVERTSDHGTRGPPNSRGDLSARDSRRRRILRSC